MKHMRRERTYWFEHRFSVNHMQRLPLNISNYSKSRESSRSAKLRHSVNCLEWFMFLAILGIMLAFIIIMLAAYYGYDFVMLFIGVLLLITGVLLEIRRD